VTDPIDYTPYLGLGAAAEPDGVSFSAFADAERVEVLLYDVEGKSVRSSVPLSRDDHGVFSGFAAGESHGALYRFAVDGKPAGDPYARYLPFGVDGPAMVYAAQTTLRAPRPKRPLSEYVIYELHVGAFTREGTYRAAMEQLPYLRELGITALELMPISSFPGERGWGYDGVAHFAPYAPYGSPDDLRAFIDRAHELGLSVLLDVVYNHFGPAGCSLPAFSPRYFHAEGDNAWGSTLDFSLAPLRAFVIDNARFWVEEVGFDGLRLDAVHAIVDRSPQHVLEALVDEVKAVVPSAVIIAEDDRNDPAIVDNVGCDAFWADDFHHSLRVLLTGEQGGYYAAYKPSLDELVETLREGVLYRGQTDPVSKKPRGKPMPDLPPRALVYCIENHDQVGNRARGDRLSESVSLDVYCAASALLLFLPATPLLFMGQEWASAQPFPFFSDHAGELGEAVRAGRKREFEGLHDVTPPDPQAEATFLDAKLDWERASTPEGQRVVTLYRRLLHLRAAHPVMGPHGRSHLRVWREGDLLYVCRRLQDEEMLLMMSFSDAELDWPLAQRGAEVLVRTDRRAPSASLAPRCACIVHVRLVEPASEP
jgi:maltooligosyltrehalose trehalohydrolase